MADLTVRGTVAGDLFDLRREFERVFHRFFRPHFHSAESTETLLAVAPPIETWMDAQDKEFHLSVPLPGVKPEELNIILQGNRLTFSGEKKEEVDKTGKKYLEREFSYGQFVRTVTLPDGVDGEKITAKLSDGILEISAPIAASALPKKIEVKIAAPAQPLAKVATKSS